MYEGYVNYNIFEIFFDRAIFGREDENLTASVVSLIRALDVNCRTIVSLMLDNTSFRTIRAIREVLSSMI